MEQLVALCNCSYVEFALAVVLVKVMTYMSIDCLYCGITIKYQILRVLWVAYYINAALYKSGMHFDNTVTTLLFFTCVALFVKGGGYFVNILPR